MKLFDWKFWSRQLHYWTSFIYALPIIIILITGLFLLLKKEVAWIQPPTQRGGGSIPTLNYELLLAAVQQVPEAEIKTWDDIDRLDVRPKKGVVKVRSENRWEIQVDHQTGAILQTAYRRSDFIESIHDGTFFHDKVKLWVFFPAALMLLLLWITGLVLFFYPLPVKLRRWIHGRTKKHNAHVGLPLEGVLPGQKGSIRILYGSESGNAKRLSKLTCSRLTADGFDVGVSNLGRYDPADLAKEDSVLILCSTHGEGDMPDGADLFWADLQQVSPSMNHMHYSVLALGDRTYEKFCLAGRRFDAHFATAGAHRLFHRMDCDVDYLDAYEAWFTGVRGALHTVITEHNHPTSSGDADVAATAILLHPDDQSFTVKQTRLLSQSGSTKEVWHVELTLDQEQGHYEVGDVLYIRPVNNGALVRELIDFLGCCDETPMTRKNGHSTPLHELLLHDYDIHAPTKQFLELVLHRISDPELKEKLQQKTFTDGLEIIDLLGHQLNPPLTPQTLIDTLRTIQPRAYSISSSLLAHPGEVHLTVDALRYEQHDRKREGVCSCFLADHITPGDRLHGYFASTAGFKLPDHPDTPIIMIGPGTGIAPFRAFLEHRAKQGHRGKNWLFFGARNGATDFLYQAELEDWKKKGHLHHLDLAFSRDQQEKVYVQHLMMKQKNEFFQWIEHGASIYVCGDAKQMAVQVDSTLHAIVRSVGEMTETEACEYIVNLRRSGRYLRDVY